MRRARSLGRPTSLGSAYSPVYLVLDAFLSDDEEFRRQLERAAAVRTAFTEALLDLTRIRPTQYGRPHHLVPADYLHRFALAKPNRFALAKPKSQGLNYLIVATEATRVPARGFSRVRSHHSYLSEGGPSSYRWIGHFGKPRKKKEHAQSIRCARVSGF